MARPSRAPKSKGQKNWRENAKKNFDFLRSTNFKLFRKIKGDSINYCDFFKFLIPVRRRPSCLLAPCVGEKKTSNATDNMRLVYNKDCYCGFCERIHRLSEFHFKLHSADGFGTLAECTTCTQTH